MTKQQWLKNNGYAEDGTTYCAIGDTYSLKEYLKEHSYYYSPIVKWHATVPLTYLHGIKHIKINFNNFFAWDEVHQKPIPYNNATINFQDMCNKITQSNSEFIGSIGNRVKNLQAVYQYSHGFQTNFGYTYTHHFDYNNNHIVWYTLNALCLPKNSNILLSGVVKNHIEISGKKTTVMTRCRIKEL